tara:strand:- start:799 stop:1197 length:399 start_codon:yes stop_codon:yes gene_type:complete
MPGKPKYCPECKGYGDLYVQSISRYGDQRIKSKTPIAGVPCTDCKGTGMITLKTEKLPQFTVEEEMEELLAEPEAEDVVLEGVADESVSMMDAKESVRQNLDETDAMEAEEEQDEVVIEEKYIEPAEGEMPL